MRHLSPSSFDATLGIDKILRQRDSAISITEQRSIQPAEITDRPRLDVLIKSASITDYVFARLRPELLDAGVLSPAQFRLALAEARLSLLPIAKAHRASAKKMGKLSRILEEESELLDLLQMYWSALLQG
jgi:hypothetical protein